MLIVDKENAIMTGSSVKNQNRLHLGYHYPRSASTIEECRAGFHEFKHMYPSLSSPFPGNYYFLSARDSHITAETYALLYDTRPLYTVPTLLNVQNVQYPYFETDEEYIHPFKVQAYFRELLTPHFKSIKSIADFESLDSIHAGIGTPVDLTINCTYNHFMPIPCDHYEYFVSFLYHIPGDLFAFTLMDGPFFSIYPYDYEKRVYTVTSVVHGVLYTGHSIPSAVPASSSEIEDRRRATEAQVRQYLPDLEMNYVNHFTSWKTKPCTDTDDRSLRFHIDHDRKLLHFYGGKITGIFQAEKIVTAYLKLHDNSESL